MNKLYVPIEIEAFVTGKAVSAERNTADIVMDFSMLDFFVLGSSIEPSPFARLKPLSSGVHLHFSLPQALRQGSENVYPAIPDRWLVKRMLKTKKIQVTSWIVESDALSDKDDAKAPRITFPAQNDNGYMYLGRCYAVGEGVPSVERINNLTALGWGHPAFSACYSFSKSVLGFYDSLEDVTDGELTYAVCGWYSEAKCDPLNKAAKENWSDLLNALNWSVPENTSFKNQTVCHGLVYGINWYGKDYDYPDGKPGGTVVSAMGNSSVEALSALIANEYTRKYSGDAGIMERFICALQYNCLESMEAPDGVFILQDMLHANGFTATGGGVKWTVRRKEKEAILPEGTGKLLDDLNKLQEESDSASRLCDQQEIALYNAWHMYAQILEDPTALNSADAQKIAKAIRETFVVNLDNTKEKLSALAAKIKTAENILLAHLKNKPFTLETVQNANFYTPNSPVVMIAGQGAGRRTDKTPEGKLPCRSELLSGINVKDYCDIAQSGMNDYLEYICEALFLTPSYAKIIKEKPKGESPHKIAYQEWKQPDATLFIEWKLDYYAARTNEKTDNTLENWTLSGIDYVYNKILPPSWYRYTGRSFFTPHSPVFLSAMIKRYVQIYESDSEILKRLNNLANLVADLPVLSQQTGDFNNMLLSLHRAPELPVEGLGDGDLAELVRKRLGSREVFAVKTNYPFNPIRGGFAQLMEVNAISVMGQVTKLVSDKQTSRALNSQAFTPSEKNKAENHAILRPRLSQPSRIRFRWLSKCDDNIEANDDTDTSPVCGYIIPNLFNRSLMVYDTDGLFKGFVKLTYKTGTKNSQWLSAPKEEITPFEKENFSSRHLREFLKSLLSSTARLTDLLQTINDRLDTITPQTDSQNLSVMWGCPLVLARAAVGLEIYGEPAYSKAYKDFGENQTRAFEETPFNAAIGDALRVNDGVIGYITDSDRLCKAGETIPLKLNKPPVKINLLFAPDMDIDIRTGILPNLKIKLPHEYVSSALDALYIAFEVNPIISRSSVISIPYLREDDAAWSWLYRNKKGYTENEDITPAASLFYDEKPVIMDGFLIRKRRKNGDE